MPVGLRSEPPLLSVLMGTRYLRTDFAPLRRAVESVLGQSFRDFEFLICDDGSSPEARAYLDRAAAKDVRIRLIRPGDRLGLASKLNACLEAAGGRFIGRMDDDDFSHPDRFRKQLEALMDDSEIGFVGCNVELFQNGRVVGIRILPEYPTLRDFYIVQPYIHPALIFRREVLSSVGAYSEGKRQELCEDYDLLLRLLKNGYRGRNLQESLLIYTIPSSARGKRTMHHRLNETMTRFCRFRELGVLPKALPYVIKPVLTGLLPERLLMEVKKRYYDK